MIEEPKEKQAQDYPFINEKIVPKRKKRWMRKLGTMLFVVCMAAVFGVVAQLVFLLSGEYLREWLHIKTERQQVNLPQPTKVEGEEMVTRKPRQTATPIVKEWSEHIVPTKIPANQIQGTLPTPSPVTGQAEPQQTPVPEPTTTKVPTINPPVPTKQPENKEENTEYHQLTETSLLYLQMYDAIRTVAEEVSDSLVIVEAIEQGVDWFQEVYENRTRTTGLILGNDGVDLLILVGTEQFSGATSLNVFFGEEVLSGRIYSMDRDYGLAVIAVSLSELSEELLKQIQMGLPAQKEDIVIGTPVIALGAPNGYEGSMEFGMITSLGSTVSVTDGELAYFTANINPYTEGYGFVVNLEGEVLGMITHKHQKNPEDAIFTVVSLDSIRGIMLHLLNHTERPYFGIKGQNIPENLKKEYELQSGVYVSEVENASPALSAGIKAGDLLVSVNNQEIEGIRSFSEVLLECGTRDTVQVILLRPTEDGLKKVRAEVVLTEKNKHRQ